MENTQDLSKFGWREIKEASLLLNALASNDKNIDKTRFMSEGVNLEFNPNSGNVFLVDEDYNVAMMNGECLEDFITLPNQGHEGFLDDLVEIRDEMDDEDKEYLDQLLED